MNQDNEANNEILAKLKQLGIPERDSRVDSLISQWQFLRFAVWVPPILAVCFVPLVAAYAFVLPFFLIPLIYGFRFTPLVQGLADDKSKRWSGFWGNRNQMEAAEYLAFHHRKVFRDRRKTLFLKQKSLVSELGRINSTTPEENPWHLIENEHDRITEMVIQKQLKEKEILSNWKL